jgi:hypothetical protein
MANNADTSMPKFGSFKPRKSAAQPHASRPDDTRSNGKRREMELGNHCVEELNSNRTYRRGSYRLDSAYDSQQYRSARKERHRVRDRVENENKNNRSSSNQTRGTTSSTQEYDIFTIDIIGDPANLQYRKSNQWTVPLYHLYGQGSIVGLAPNVKIDRGFNDQNSYKLMYPPKDRSAKVIQLLEIEEPLEHGAGAGDPGEAETEGDGARDAETEFITLPFGLKRDESQ